MGIAERVRPTSNLALGMPEGLTFWVTGAKVLAVRVAGGSLR